MQTIVTIQVYDPAWLAMSQSQKDYWKELKEPEDLSILKFQEGLSFDLADKIVSYSVRQDTSYDLQFIENGKSANYTLSDVFVIEFNGK
jgi:hypothetical protein